MSKLHDNFIFKTLNMEHLDEIVSLLNKHYIEDDEKIIRIVYSKGFLYWYLRKIPHGLILGLTNSNRLVGMVTARIMDLSINDTNSQNTNFPVQIPYVNFLCVQKNLRGIGLSKMLTTELQSRLCEMNIPNALFKSLYKFSNHHLISDSKQYIIPINCPKLLRIGMLADSIDHIPLENNYLHLLKSVDIPFILPKLELATKSYAIHPAWTEEFIRQYILPKKNIVYSFVIKNSNNEITDFISVYQYFIYCLDVKEVMSIAHLGYYFCTTINLTQMINCLVDKLKRYGLDGLVINDIASNTDINVTKFEFIHKNVYYYTQDLLVNTVEPSKICIFPF